MTEKETDIKQFRPRNVILSGKSNRVETIDQLNELKSSIEHRHQEQQEIIEKNKKKKVLVKKIHADGNVRTETIISDPPGKIKDCELVKRSIDRKRTMLVKPVLTVKTSKT